MTCLFSLLAARIREERDSLSELNSIAESCTRSGFSKVADTTRDAMSAIYNKLTQHEELFLRMQRGGKMKEEEILKQLDFLAGELFRAKKAEDEAKKKRISIEEEIARYISTPERGSKTVKAGDIKITVKRDLTYKCSDVNAALMECGDYCFKRIPEKMEFDSAAYEKLREESPREFAKISQYVEVKPKKVSVSLKL